MTLDPASRVTEYLRLVRAGGDAEAANDLWSVVHDELRVLARTCLRGSGGDQTLQATALVHEAYLRLVKVDDDAERGGWHDRVHFFAVAAKAMRQILSNQVRSKRAGKRDPGGARVTLAMVAASDTPIRIDIIALNDALAELSTLDERLAEVVELRFFAGMAFDEIAHVLGVSDRTVERYWRTARAWLSGRLRELEQP